MLQIFSDEYLDLNNQMFTPASLHPKSSTHSITNNNICRQGGQKTSLFIIKAFTDSILNSRLDQKLNHTNPIFGSLSFTL